MCNNHDNKFKHMDYIQSAISRMASNSFYLKSWNVAAIIAIVSWTGDKNNWKPYLCALALNIVFWVLDSYYLRQEKLFRELYKKVSAMEDDSKIDFSMDTQEFKEKVPAVQCIMVSNISVTLLYLTIALVLIVLILVFRG